MGINHLMIFTFLLSDSFGLCQPQPWVLGFATSPTMVFAADVDGDGRADMVTVSPSGDTQIVVSLSIDGQKAGVPFQARTGWGKDCQAACVGEFDGQKGADVAGLFAGKTLRLATAVGNGRFHDVPEWISLPKAVDAPSLSALHGGREIIAFSTRSGEGFLVTVATKKAVPCRVPRGSVWIGDEEEHLVGQDREGHVFWIDRSSLKRGKDIGKESSTSRPAAAPGLVAFGETLMFHGEATAIDQAGYPVGDKSYALGSVAGKAQPDLFEFRFGKEPHTGNEVLLRRIVTPGDPDPDDDGLTDDQETQLGTDPRNPDTDSDGLLDGWEVNGYRGMDLKSLGCDPRHADVVCLVSRFDGVNEGRFNAGMTHVEKYYSELKATNPDGTPGIRFHKVDLAPVTGADQRSAWWTNRDKFRPANQRGMVHWMQVTPGGGGQSGELDDGGGCGENALWAVFTHEFGHQLGLPHDGFWPNGSCPIYTSLMNYCYSYSFEDDPNKVHYSDGRLDGYVLRETDLDETIPLPYEKVKFLEKGPYHFRLKPNGDTTLIDWNWNGVFGEKHVKADINYAYGTHAGRRDDVGKTMTAPWLFTHGGRAFVVVGQSDAKPEPNSDPTLSSGRPGRLVLRRLQRPFKWDDPWILVDKGVTGDPVAVSYRGRIHVFFPSEAGVRHVTVRVTQATASVESDVVVSAEKTLVPSVVVHDRRLYLFLWDPATGIVRYQATDSAGRWSLSANLDALSVNPVEACTDTLTGELIVSLAQNQDRAKTHRWQIRRYATPAGRLVPGSQEWVGGAAGTSRLMVLFDPDKANGPHGRVILYGLGMVGPKSPWSCVYMANQIEDKSVGGGWMVKRYYDEWTQSRSAPAAAWFGGDIIYAYRWVDGGQGPTDNTLHVAYQGLGIQSEPMGDFDDISFIRSFGLRASLLYMNQP